MDWHFALMGGGIGLWLWLRLRAKSFPSRRRPLTPRYSRQRLDVMRERNRRAKQKEGEKETGEDDAHQV